MIIEFVINSFFIVIQTIVAVFDLLPDMPAVITNYTDIILDYSSTGFGVVHEVLSKELTVAILFLVTVLTTTILLWQIFNYAYKRIRG